MHSSQACWAAAGSEARRGASQVGVNGGDVEGERAVHGADTGPLTEDLKGFAKRRLALRIGGRDGDCKAGEGDAEIGGGAEVGGAGFVDFAGDFDDAPIPLAGTRGVAETLQIGASQQIADVAPGEHEFAAVGDIVGFELDNLFHVGGGEFEVFESLLESSGIGLGHTDGRVIGGEGLKGGRCLGSVERLVEREGGRGFAEGALTIPHVAEDVGRFEVKGGELGLDGRVRGARFSRTEALGERIERIVGVLFEGFDGADAAEEEEAFGE